MAHHNHTYMQYTWFVQYIARDVHTIEAACILLTSHVPSTEIHNNFMQTIWLNIKEHKMGQSSYFLLSLLLSCIITFKTIIKSLLFIICFQDQRRDCLSTVVLAN